jgi:thiamine-monophosphate kinase
MLGMSDAGCLIDLGERRIIEEILRPRYASTGIPRFGDDCSFVVDADALAHGTLVAHTDPCPETMASFLGHKDLYYAGWLLATINLSDLAASGARPLGFLSSVVLPNDTTVEQFLKLLDGIDECCSQCGTRVIGGNLKEGSRVELTGSAIGLCDGHKAMSRSGCKDGDLVAVIGDLGLFWAGVLAARNNLVPDGSEKSVLLRNVLTPMPKIQIGHELAQRSVLSACLDNSDGLYASFVQLSRTNHVEINVNMDEIQFPREVLHISSLLGMDPIRLAIGWGDWQLIGCVDPSRVAELRESGKQYGVPIAIIGKVSPGRGVILHHNGRIGEMAAIDSERFTTRSWFTSGLESYIDMLAKGPLWKEDR